MFKSASRIFYILIIISLKSILGHTLSFTSYALIPCTDNSDCVTVNGTCLKNFCNCNNSYGCKPENRIIGNKLNVNCTSNSDCSNVLNAVCHDTHKCECDIGYVPSENERKCLKVSHGPGGECEESVQCYTKTPSTGCHENKCVCQQHMHEFNGSCYKNVGLGSFCQLSEECSLISHSVCKHSKCQCVHNYVSNGSHCLVIASGLNSSCSENIQCETQLSYGSECSTRNICVCREVFHYKSSINRCVHDILLNEICQTHNDCHQPGTGASRLECALGVCKCKSPYLEEDGYCISSSTSAILFKSFVFFLGTLIIIK